MVRTRTAGETDNNPQAVDWEQLLLVYLHDPVDKAIDIRGHEARAARYASRALAESGEIRASAALADQITAISERIPVPTAGDAGERAVGVENGRLEIRHPVSGEPEHLDGLRINEDAVLEAVSGIVNGLDQPRQRFLALWRLLPDRLGGALSRLPADTRIPDHTVFNHADITSGLWASRGAGAEGRAYLSLSLGPVQAFIEAARSVRDLWSGSAILSWLTFQGMTPVLERFGPTAFVFPALRGNPLMDLWLRREASLEQQIDEPSASARRAPSIPNRFVALVPWGLDGRIGRAMERLCADAVHGAWQRISDDVLNALDPGLSALDPLWASRWHRQIKAFFDVQTSVMPERPLDDRVLADLFSAGGGFEGLWPDAWRVRQLAAAIPAEHRPGYDLKPAGQWQAQLEASARLMEAQRAIRHIPSVSEDGPSPAKCSLFGTFEQMGPADLRDGKRFWDDAERRIRVNKVRLRSGERFSAVALCKRFAAPLTLRNELGLDPASLRFPDTATVAAGNWLDKAGIDPESIRRQWGSWSGRWLHPDPQSAAGDDEETPPADIQSQITAARTDSRPPSYYAILMMDADDMGLLLNGDKTPKLRDVLHPRMAEYFDGLGEAARNGLEARRPVGPGLHASISEALNNFASRIVPDVVGSCKGTLIYSGGDDVLALLPARRAAQCAFELERRFRGLETSSQAAAVPHDGRQLLTMGRTATLSAGIAFVHIKEDLRVALQAARDMEKQAKRFGKNRLALRFMRRSGEHSETLLGWEQVSWFQELIQKFVDGASDRWAYRLRAELPTLSGRIVPGEAVEAEIRRLLMRASDDHSSRAEISADAAVGWWRDFAQAGHSPGRPAGDKLAEFVTICQGASFVGRGEDE